jgi:hypothetical protein
MLDQSGSMLLGTGGERSKWEEVVRALQTFVARPDIGGIGARRSCGDDRERNHRMIRPDHLDGSPIYVKRAIDKNLQRKSTRSTVMVVSVLLAFFVPVARSLN